MFHHIAARFHTRAVKVREALESRASRGEEGIESIEVVVLSVVGLVVVVALGAAIRALVMHYQAQLTPRD